MLEIGDGNQPVVHPEIRDTIPHKKVHPAVLGAEQVQNSSGNGETNVTQENELRVFSLVQGARRVEVVDTGEEAVLLALAAALGLALVVVVSSNVAEQVHGPAKQLLAKRVNGSSQRSLLHQLVQVVDGLLDTRSVIITGLGDKNHVTGKVASGLVVLAVGDLP